MSDKSSGSEGHESSNETPTFDGEVIQQSVDPEEDSKDS